MQDPARSALREVLNDWDPIGVIEHGAPADEYDCLITPVLHRLDGGAQAGGIAAFLRSEPAGHFGLDPDRHGIDVESVAARLVALRGG